MSSVDRDLETWQVLCRRMGEKRRMPETIQVYSKSLGSVTRVAEKAFDPAQAREIYKQLIVELNANGWTEEAHRLVVRLGETLSSAPSSTPLGGEGDQAEERSGWQNADSSFHPAFRLGEERRGRRDAAQQKAPTQGDLRLREIFLPLELARAEASLAEAQAQRKALDQSGTKRTRAAFDLIGEFASRKRRRFDDR